MIIKAVVIIAFILIIFSLGSALFHLINHKTEESSSEKTVKALTFRISLSILLFIFLFIAVATGVFKPHGLGVKIHAEKPVQTDTLSK
ncbi:MAG: hypothetical protein RIR39_1263 [Pseudomonadota bacterium]|jgi:hypothetical protein